MFDNILFFKEEQPSEKEPEVGLEYLGVESTKPSGSLWAEIKKSDDKNPRQNDEFANHLKNISRGR